MSYANLVRLELGVPMLPPVVPRNPGRCARTSFRHYFEHLVLIFIVRHTVFATPTTNFDLKLQSKLMGVVVKGAWSKITTHAPNMSLIPKFGNYAKQQAEENWESSSTQ